MTQQFTPVAPDGIGQGAQSESALHELGQTPPPPLLLLVAPDDDGPDPVGAGTAIIAAPEEEAPWPAALFVVPRNPASMGGYP